MEFEHLSREDLERYATSGSLVASALFQMHPHILVNMLGDMGEAMMTAKRIQEAGELAHAHEVMGLKRPEIPEHEDLNAAIDNAAAAVALAFETTLNAVELLNYTALHCKCLPCQRRRGLANADTN